MRFSACGRLDSEKLAAAYYDQRRSDIPMPLSEAIFEASDVLAKSGDPQAADFVLDKAYFAELSALADEKNSGFFKEYVNVYRKWSYCSIYASI